MNILNNKLFLFIQNFATVVLRDFFIFVNFAKVRCHKFETKGAYHLAKKSGNFGLRSNGKAIFRKIFSEIVDNLQR